MSITVITDRERIARDALEKIAERGITVPCPSTAIPGTTSRANYRCPVCRFEQHPQGPCLNRNCLTAIANKALDELRRTT